MTLLDPLAEAADRRNYVPLDASERALEALAAHLRKGRSPVLLTGPSGIGKSLLLHVFAEREQSRLQRVRVSESLLPAPEELASWLLHYLFREWAPEGTDIESVLAERIRGLGAERMLLLVDQIQRSPRESVRKLAELARTGMPELAVVVAGANGEDLRERMADLAPEAVVCLPDSLPDAEIVTLYEAIVADPGFSPRLRDRLADVSHGEVLCAAAGLPLLLKKELIRREERAAAPAPQLRGMTPPLETRPAPAIPAAAAGVEPERRLRRRPLRVHFLRDALRACASMAIAARGAAATLLRNAEAAVIRVGEKVIALGRTTVGGVQGSSMQLVRVVVQSARASSAIAEAAVRGACTRLAASAASSGLAARVHLTSARGSLTLLPARIGATSRSAGALIRRSSTALSRSLRRRARGTSGALEAARQAVRRAAPVAGVSATALLTIALLYLGRPELGATRMPAVSPPPPAELSRVAVPASNSMVNVQVNARPWASVRIDGKDLGPTPLSQRLAPGTYELEASFPDGRKIRRNLEVSSEHRFVSLP